MHCDWFFATHTHGTISIAYWISLSRYSTISLCGYLSFSLSDCLALSLSAIGKGEKNRLQLMAIGSATRAVPKNPCCSNLSTDVRFSLLLINTHCSDARSFVQISGNSPLCKFQCPKHAGNIILYSAQRISCRLIKL